MQSVSIAARSLHRRHELALVGFVFFLIFAFIWFLRGSSRWATPIFTVLLGAALIYGHIQRGQTLREVGFRLDTLPAAALRLAPVAAAIISLAVYAGHVLDSAEFPKALDAVLGLLNLFVFGTAQQYMLLAFFYQRFAEVLPSKALAVLAAAAVFAVLHLPNPFLVAVTFFAGMISALVYARAPNLWVSGIVHGLISFSLYWSLPLEIIGGMRVGPAYWR